MRTTILFIHFLLITVCFGQGLFESALGSGEEGSEQNYQLNGAIRGGVYVGKIPGEDEADIKNQYGELALKMTVRKKSFGDGFAEVRFRKGNEYGKKIESIDFREGYLSTHLGKFDFIVGQQIVVWGRADGFNPTNNITPMNMLVKSPDEDDKRLSNMLVRSYYNLNPVRFEFIWIPVYKSSTVPVEIMPLPAGVKLNSDTEEGFSNISDGSFGGKIDLTLPSFGASISFFNGQATTPGIKLDLVNVQSPILLLQPYRMNVIGCDFSTTLSALSLGLRGEFAYRMPFEYDNNTYTPSPDFQYVLGIDREFGDLSLILQYFGRFVEDFEELTIPQDPAKMMGYTIAHKNRLISFQTEEITHSAVFRPSWSLLHETLTLEALGSYNFTTEEIYIVPRVSYDITDALIFSVGGDIFAGPDATLYGTTDHYLSAGYMQVKVEF